MKILIDTPIWSLAFRRRSNDHVNGKIIDALTELIRDMRIAIIGPIRQEVLSGISDKNKFEELKEKMSIFTDYIIQTNDYELAAEYSNICRKHGIQGSHTDFLICTTSIKNGWKIFTEDKDFFEYKKYLPIKLFTIK
ncbi:MAG: PIN domain-containing protein [Planctomycetaceae bacterium]|jgi:predicted nucleic acid-binding protein|nr:PIN domain-containing protein [Planctomycetaceae bacterium]